MTSIKFKRQEIPNWGKDLTKQEMLDYMIDYPWFHFWYRVRLFFGSEKFVREEYNRFVNMMRN